MLLSYGYVILYYHAIRLFYHTFYFIMLILILILICLFILSIIRYFLNRNDHHYPLYRNNLLMYDRKDLKKISVKSNIYEKSVKSVKIIIENFGSKILSVKPLNPLNRNPLNQVSLCMPIFLQKKMKTTSWPSNIITKLHILIINQLKPIPYHR